MGAWRLVLTISGGLASKIGQGWDWCVVDSQKRWEVGGERWEVGGRRLKVVGGR